MLLVNLSSSRPWRILPLAFVAWLLMVFPSHADSYAQWTARVFTAQEQSNPAISGENATPANDGVSNLLKFAFDLDPHKNGVAGLPTVSTVAQYDYNTGQNESYLAITYRVPYYYSPENITCVPEVSPDLRIPNGWIRGQNAIAYYGYQYPQNAGDPYLYTFSVLSPVSQNPAGLFMRLRVIEGHTLPPDWLQKYFPGVTNVDPEADGDIDGLTNWQEYLNGTDPTDYYNAQLPELLLVGGGNQRAVAGSMLAQPISVEVNYYGDQNAPLTFTATGGALLAPDASGTFSPAATINVRSTGQIDVYGYQTYVGQVYVYLPTTANTISTITATATTAGQSASVSTTAVASDPNVQPPGGFGVDFNTDTYASLSFTPSDATLPTSIEVSQDEGITWSTWGIAPPGSTGYTLTGLPQETELLIRAFTGADSGGSGANANGAQTNGSPTPSPTSPPTGNTSATLYLYPHILGDQVGYSGSNWSYAGFLGQNRYLHLHHVITDSDLDDDDDGGTETDDVTVTVHPEDRTYSSSGNSIDYTVHSETIDSDASKHGTGADDDGPVDDGTHSVTLSNVYPLATFKLDSEGWWPGFSGSEVDGANRAKHDFSASPYDFGADYGVSFGFTHIHFIEKLKYRWKVNKDPNGHLGFDEVFLPKDGSALKHHVLNWDTKGATESPVATPWTLDPLAVNNKAEGIYRVLTIELRATGQQDGAGIPGSIIPSNKTDGTGQKHFVVPKAAGGVVTITANLGGQTESGMDFDSLYEFVPMGSNATISSSTCQVKTDNAGEYTVQVRTKDSSQSVIASMNVWVVWATGSIVTSPLPVATLHHVSSGIVTIDGTSGGGAFLTLDQDYQFKFVISPSGITDKNADIPNLIGGKDTAGDGQLGGQSPYSTNPLSGGAKLRWDVTRRVAYHFLNPNLIPYGKMTGGYGTIYQGEPQANITTIPFPSSSIIGNDDSSVGDEDNNPYASVIKPELSHNVGEITSLDSPNAALADAGGVNGYTFEEDDTFQEFARFEIGNVWYNVSDPVLWKLIMKITFQNGQWTDSGSTTGPGN